jgi:vacuolar protein sorting-associated protein VTA1
VYVYSTQLQEDMLMCPVRFYIVQKIIGASLHLADAECGVYTTDLMEQLEQTKADNPNEDALLDEVAAYAYCEQFALQTFAKGEREMTANTVTRNTADTLLAAATFLEMLAIWKQDPEPEIKSKHKFAKYHAVRILKAIQAGEDPNLTNPVHESPPQAASPSALDPNDPEVQNIDQGMVVPPNQNPYQAYVETGPTTPAHPSPRYSSPKVSPPPDFPSAPTGYGSHRDVSPISQPSTSRHGSVASVGGGYFPRVNVPTFTADNTAPSLPTALSTDDENMADVFDQSTLPTDSQLPQAPQVPNPQNFYENAASPPLFQPPQQPATSKNTYQPSPQPPAFASPPPLQPSQPPSSSFQTPTQQHYQYTPQPRQPHQSSPQQHQQALTPSPQTLHQGPFKTDEESQMDATKHAKWAISALNFEDVNTAVKELRLALRALGAN